VDPKGPATGEDLVLRGGCAEYDPGACRSSGRLRGKHGQRMGIIGFRVALEPPFAPAARPPTPATPANLQRELALDLGGARMDLVLVPAGEFMMGANDGEPNEKPVHKVTISQPFYIGKYHVTVAQFRAFADATKFQTEAEKVNRGWSAKDGKWQEMNGITWRTPGFKQEDTHPVCVISWNDAQEFCRWATKVTGRHVGLPTEAQWEYAARGPNGPKYPWGDTWDGTRLNHADVNWRKSGATVQEWGASNDNDGFPWTAPVGSYKNASWCGAFDMAGGAWQRCEDFYSDNYYQGSPELDPKGPGAGDSRVLRGGSWNNGPGHGRAAQRHRHDPASRDAGVGFRCTVDCDATETGSRATLPEAPAPTPATPANLQKDLALNLSGGVRMDCVLVTAGEFMMGADDADAKPEEKPVHKVKITKPFYIGKFDVTVAQFRAFADAVKYQTDAEKQNKGATVKDGKWQELSGVHWRKPGFKQEDNHPAVIVTWNDAQEFCKWASKATGRTVRLPTEAEWEYAARGPQTRKYPWGDKWEGLVANVADASLRRTGFSMEWGEIKEDDGYPFTSPVGHYRINLSWCGAYDMAGNVWQWCQDCFNDKYYGESPAVDPQGPAKDGGRVLRGGAWDGGPRRSASRLSCAPGFPVANAGFRVVAEPSKAP